MTELRLDDRVAVVTGGGRNIGRACCELFARRGARVVVADVGSDVWGNGSDSGPADEVVEAIRSAGGQAISVVADVSSADGGQAIVEAAVDAFGRIDVLVNNAGILTPSELPDATPEDLGRELSVHVGGAFNVTRAAWTYLCDSGAGSVLFMSSSALYGYKAILSYNAAKGGSFGLMRGVAASGREHNVRANAVAPHSPGRMRFALGDDYAVYKDAAIDPAAVEVWGPHYIAHPILYLCHPDTTVSGRMFFAGGGRVSEMLLAETVGYVDPDLTAESVRDRWDEITDRDGYFVPVDAAEWHATRMELHAKAGAARLAPQD